MSVFVLFIYLIRRLTVILVMRIICKGISIVIIFADDELDDEGDEFYLSVAHYLFCTFVVIVFLFYQVVNMIKLISNFLL